MPPLSREPGLSQAAARIVASVEAAVDGKSAVTIAGLIAALWEDGSRAAEILESAGYDSELLSTDFAEDPANPKGEPLLATTLTEARRIARRAGGEIEIATEHLLAALVIVAPQIGERLAARGVDVAALIEPASAGVPPAAVPLAVDPASQLLAPVVNESAAIGRVLDAATNRCREGLRVVEDYVRFTLDDATLSEALKTIRHDLAGALAALNADEWIRYRDTPGDVGVRIHTASERRRASLESLATANCKRVEEALRTLEEFSKFKDPAVSTRIESLRYRIYSVEQVLASRRHAQSRLADARLYLLLTDRLCPRGLGPVARAALAGGVDVIQLREKETSGQRMLELARMLRDWTYEAGALLIINDRPDIAALVNADGVHLGQDDLPPAAARRIVGAQSLIGVSAHSIEQAREASLSGADYLGIGPVFPSNTKTFTEFPGLDLVRAAAAEIRMPWFAIGGISRDNLSQVRNAGAERIAVSSAVAQAAEPEAVTRELAAALRAPVESRTPQSDDEPEPS
jgi:thiamine-phosphate pyrophosphorylase